MSEKYPRTFHLPWSPGATKDDRKLVTAEHFLNVPVVVTEKMDGSNLCMTKMAVFARSHNGPPTHESFNVAKSLHAQVCHSIPDGVSVFGEYVFAVHSIRYSELPGYFLVFGVREDSTGKWWDWDTTEALAGELGFPTVPVWLKSSQILAPDNKLYWKGQYETEKQLETETKLEYLFHNGGMGHYEKCEGYVVRLAGEFTDFEKSVAKYVRANHVQTDQHWTQKTVEKNLLKKKEK